MKTFTLELFGTIDLPTYLAWIALSIIGAITASLIRNHVTTLKSFPVNPIQLLTGLLITFISIRFSNEILGLNPNAFGALIIGATNNEIALGLLKKFLSKKEDVKIQALAEEPIQGGGTKNDSPKTP